MEWEKDNVPFFLDVNVFKHNLKFSTPRYKKPKFFAQSLNLYNYIWSS